MTDGIVGEFLSLKSETDADLLAMQCGDFYEFFADDAETVSEELDLAVSHKSSHGSSYPMAGVPVSELTPYLSALVERGYRVAVADQFETDAGDIYRDIVRIATPGTLLETTDAEAQYLAAIVSSFEHDRNRKRRSGGRHTETGTNDDAGPYGFAFADVTTGRFFVTTADTREEAFGELYRFDPAEIIPGPEVRNDADFVERLREKLDASLTLYDADAFAPGRARHVVKDHFGAETIHSVGLDDSIAIRAAGAILSYVDSTGVGVLQSMTRLQRYSEADRVALDATTQRNLELIETMRGDRSGSLLSTIDHTVTAPGRRLLREWLTRPRRDRTELERRHDAVEALASAALERDRIRETIDGSYDLERLASRAASGSADARDLQSIATTLSTVPALEEAIEGSTLETSPLRAILQQFDRAAAERLREEIADAIAEDPPGTIKQGGIFTYGYDSELDELIDGHEAALSWIDGLEGRVKSSYGLQHVTVDRNRTDGYYIQVGRSEADDVPDHFEEIKTLKNSKRFVTDELEERERQILQAEEARSELEYELFVELRDRVARRAELLRDVGRAIAEVDALASLSTHAAGQNWIRPELTDDRSLSIEAGRHPTVEATTEFVPNDLHLDDNRRFLVVTGPNMSGKSTYMRQAALITLLAQAGSFVPARSATVGLVDGIYTRVGALDELAGGRSTFMVEMQELSNILHSATEESLVILDEVGRGTATYDGISIAWAATEYLHGIGAKTLFATHYHELTALADRLSGVENVHMAADERDGDVTFLWTIADGPADRSYGVHVADLAGVPEPVVDRADDVLERLRADRAIDVRGDTDADEPKQVVFDLGSGSIETRRAGTETGREHRTADDASGTTRRGGDTQEGNSPRDPSIEAVLEELEATDVNETPPIELMAKVQEWQTRLEDGSSEP